MATKRNQPSIDELLHRDQYQPEDLAELLNMDVDTIRQDAFSGDLQATILDHHIVSISREAVIAWLNDRA